MTAITLASILYVALFLAPVAPTWRQMAEIPLPPALVEPDDDVVVQEALGEKPDTPAAEVLTRLHVTNIQEIMLGKRASKKGSAKKVVELGRELARDHAAADARLLAFAKRHQLRVSATGQAIAEPPRAAGRVFDEKFVDSTLEIQQKAIADVQQGRDASTDDGLNALLDSILPMLERHRDLAQQIADKRSKR